MRKITKFKRSIKAVSPIISVLLMIALAVVAGLVAYAWVMGYIGTQTEQTGNQIEVQSYTGSSNLVLYVQNTGNGLVHLKWDASVYVNDKLYNILTYKYLSSDTQDAFGKNLQIAIGRTITITTDYMDYKAGDKIKVVTYEGTTITVSGQSSTQTTSGSSTTQYTVNFAVSPSGTNIGTTTPSGSNTYNAGSTIAISAAPGSGYTFDKWASSSNNIQITSINALTTTAQINGDGTITANFYVTGTQPTPTPTTPVNPTEDIIISPVADFTFVPTNPSVNTDVYFTDASIAGNGTINNWYWNFGDGATSTTQQTTHKFTTSGIKTVSLTVTDTNGKTSTATHTIPVGQSGAVGPVAGFGFSPQSPKVGDTVTFTDESIAGGSAITQWSWNFGDGATSTTQNPTHIYQTTGIKTVQLTVTDSNGKTSSATTTIEVRSNGGSGGTGEIVTVTFNVSPVGSGTTIPDVTKTYTVGAIDTFTATKIGDYTFSSWTFNGPIQLSDPYSSVTSATINGAGTVTANFVPTTSNSLTFQAGTGQTLLTGQPSSKITLERTGSSPVTVTLLASSGAFYSDQYCTQEIHEVPIASGANSVADFYYKATTAGTPTITAQASGYSSVSTTFTINTPASVTPMSGSTGFDDSNWARGWDSWSNPPWGADTTTYYSGTRSASSYATHSWLGYIQTNQGPFSSNAMDATGAKYITVSFYYRVHETTTDDFQIRYSGTSATNYRDDIWTILGTNGNNLGGSAQDTWIQYTATITDPAAFTSYFRLSFLTQDLNQNLDNDDYRQVNVDKLEITIYK